MHRARSLATVYYWNNVYKKGNEDKVFPLFLPKELALEIISEEEYNMLFELAGRTTPEDNYKEFVEVESAKYIPPETPIEEDMDNDD